MKREGTRKVTDKEIPKGKSLSSLFCLFFFLSSSLSLLHLVSFLVSSLLFHLLLSSCLVSSSLVSLSVFFLSLSPCDVVCLWCVVCVVVVVVLLVVVVCAWCVCLYVLRHAVEKKKTVCRFKTAPCVRSKRPRVCRHHAHMCFNMCAWCQYTF